MSSDFAVREYVDSVLVAPSRPRDKRALRALRRGHARYVYPHGKPLPCQGKRRPGVRVGNRTYLAPLDVHQPDAVAMEFIRSALAHGRLAVLRIDVARDFACGSPEAADALHEQLRHRAFLSGARGRVRVSHGSGFGLGTTYMGVREGKEGTSLVIYSDHRAAMKHGSGPVCHVELRHVGARVVRAALGRALDQQRAWKRVRLVDRISGVPPRLLRAAQNAGPQPYAQDVADVLQRHKLDRRPVFGRALPFGVDTPRDLASAVLASVGAVGRGLSATPQSKTPQLVRQPDSGPGLPTPRPRLHFRRDATQLPRFRFHKATRFRYRPSLNNDKESTA